MEAIRDQNHVPVALGASSDDPTLTLPLLVDPITGRLLVETAGTGSVGSIRSATDSGDHQNYNLSGIATSSSYFVVMNNGSYSTDDSTYPFSVTGTVLTFTSALPTDLASTKIKLVCV